MTAAALVLALRGATAVLVLTTLAGGIPRVVQLGLAAVFGLWSMIVAGAPLDVATWSMALEGGLWLVAAREVVIGATLGLLGVLPLLAAATAGQLVDATGSARQGPYAMMFGVLAAAVFVGIDGHIEVVRAVVTSFASVPALASVQPRALASLGALIPSAVSLAIPWLVTAAVVEIAVGAGVRLAGRAGAHTPTGAAVPAALVMMTATLVSTLAIGIAALVRG